MTATYRYEPADSPGGIGAGLFELMTKDYYEHQKWNSVDKDYDSEESKAKAAQTSEEKDGTGYTGLEMEGGEGSKMVGG